MTSKSKKMNLRDCLNDNTLDLSMSDLEDVPVKDIALIKKGTNLDLSINKITVLPADFATLVHLTKLDLSKNQLVSLPMNFGELVHLKHLDLYCNKLENLPVSFGLMKSLRWLDLKDNPLKPALATVAGQCLDQQQCQTCARKMVIFMQNIQQQIEDVKTERQMENEQERKSRDVTQPKKKKKSGKWKEKKKGDVKVPSDVPSGDVVEDEPILEEPEWTAATRNTKPNSGDSCCGKLFKMTFLFAILIGISLATLCVVDRDRFTALQDSANRVWTQLVASLPPQVVQASQHLVLKIQDGYLWLSTNESFRHFLVHAKSLCDVVCNWVFVWMRTLCENVPIYMEAVRKAIGI